MRERITFKYIKSELTDWHEYEVTAEWVPPKRPSPIDDHDDMGFAIPDEDGEIHDIEVYDLEADRWLSEKEAGDFLIDNYSELYDEAIDNS